MKAWFNCDINSSNVTKITIDFDNDSDALYSLITGLRALINENKDKQVIGVFIDSYSHYDKRSINYSKAKQVFFSMGVPLQVVRNDRLIQSDGLKWAASGNNPDKFPEGYIITLESKEKNELVKIFDRFSTLKHSTVSPSSFTEKGLYMLATILKP